jgi:hypothetical protein
MYHRHKLLDLINIQIHGDIKLLAHNHSMQANGMCRKAESLESLTMPAMI